MEQEDYRRLILSLVEAAYVEGDIDPERRAVLEFTYLYGDPDAFRRHR